MSQPQPTAGSVYIVQQGDSLSSIAERAYGDQSRWQEIYNANAQVIGPNPDLLLPGTKIFLLPQPQRSLTYPIPQNCLISVQALNIRANPTDGSTWIASYPRGTTLNFYEVVEGEMVNGNPYWGHSTQNHYYWMGGTNRPNG